MAKTKTTEGGDQAVADILGERARCRELHSIARKYDIDIETVDKWVDDGLSPDEATRSVVDTWMASNPRIAPTSSTDIDVGADGLTRFERDSGAGLAMRFGAYRKEDWPNATPERNVSTVRIARECLRQAGQRVEGMGPGDLVTRAIGHGTGHFANILENSLTKGISHFFQEESQSWRRFCAIGESSKLYTPNSRVSASAISDLQETPELVPVEEVTFTDRGEDVIVRSFAGRCSISRQALINDDLGAFDRVPMMLGQAAARDIMRQAISVLTTNAAMSDGDALYHANHSNLGSAGALSAALLGEAVELMRLQTSNAGESTTTYLDIAPSVLLVPANLEYLASQILTDITPATTANVVPRNIRDLELVATAHLDANSTTEWYVFAPPTLPTLEVLFLHGVQGPQLFRNEHNDTILGVSWTIIHDFGVGAVEWRGTVRGPGA